MLHHLLRSGRYFALLLCFCIWSASDAYAQRSTSRSTTRSTGGSRTGGGGSSGGFYDNSMIGEAMISIDPETRQIIIMTDDETNVHIENVIKNLDRPKPQVLIKVVFLEVTYKNSSDIGLEGYYSRKLSGSVTGLVNQVFGMAAQGAAPVPPGAGLYQVFGSDFNVTLRAIAEAGKLEVLSRPSILARNNQQATITVGQEVPFITNVSFSDNGRQNNTIQYQDVGIILNVTPFITSNGLVEMIVAPEISTLTAQTVPISEGINAPVIAKRSAETVVVTPHAQPVIIGGLMESNKTSSDRKIPLLGDIPVLGNLFKRKVKEDTKTELIIFLTPYVVADPSQLAAMTKSEVGKSELTDKAFSNQELEKFLEGVPVKPSPVPGQIPGQDSKNKKKPVAPKSR
jgi:general secretion pathway protein D